MSGSYIRTEEIKQKQSLVMKSKYLNGFINPMTGIHRFGVDSPHYKPNKLPFPKCKICDKILTKRSAIYCIKHYKRVGISRPGSLNPNWKGGLKQKNYPLGWNRIYTEQVRNRDNYTCQECGVPEVECITKLHVHHIDFNKHNIDLDNLISLCHSCHAKTTVSKLEKVQYWTNYYQEKINGRKVK
jgi:hypothetical protein